MSGTPADVAAASSKFLATRAAEKKRWLEAMHARCEKKSYETPREAQRALSTIRERSTDLRVPIRFYRCDRCSLMHLTSWPAPDTSRRVF